MRATTTTLVGLTLIAAALSACGSSEKITTPTVAEAAVATTPEAPVDSEAPAPTPAPVVTSAVEVTAATVDTAVPVDTLVVSETVVTADTILPEDAPGNGTPFCTAVAEMDAASDAVSVAFEAATPPEELSALFATYTDKLDALLATTPDEIKADMSGLNDAFDEFGTILGAAEWDLEAMFTDPANEEFITKMDSAEFEVVGNNVDAFTNAECGIKVGD